MKKHLIILSLLFSCAFGYKITTYEPYSPYNYCPCYKTPYFSRVRPVYNPYSNYYNPYFRNYTFTNTNSVRNRKIRKKFNKVSFLNRNNGGLTGYSVPVNKDDIYKQMGISPYDYKQKQKYNSVNCTQELFSTPSGDEMYYKNGEYYKDLKGVSGKTGVTIIYD